MYLVIKKRPYVDIKVLHDSKELMFYLDSAKQHNDRNPDNPMEVIVLDLSGLPVVTHIDCEINVHTESDNDE